MRAILVGGGKVGAFLAKELSTMGYAVVVIEANPERAEKVAIESEALVVHGDGTDLQLLKSLELRATDFFVALTGIDEDNLVACQMAKVVFKIDRVLARLNSPRNRATFNALSIPVVSVTDLLVQVISRALHVDEVVRVAVLGQEGVSLFETELPTEFEPRPVSAMALPDGSLIVLVHRGAAVMVPRGDTVLEPLDRLLVLATTETKDAVHAIVTGA